jgi:HPt (histidine-containing phosphotransfer) domain-containing protein
MEANNKVLDDGKVMIDLSLVYEICGDDEDTTLKMVKIFTDTIPSTLEKLNSQNQNKDWINLYKTAHTAKSSLSIIKIPLLYDWVTTVEHNARHNKDLDSIDPLITKINKAFTDASALLVATFSLD